MIIAASLVVGALLGGIGYWNAVKTQERAALARSLGRKYPGYAWPVARGCRQIDENSPNFANNTRQRKGGGTRAHLGIDIVPPDHDLRVFAAKDGIVTASSPARGNGWGNYVILRHGDRLSTVYAHLVTPSKLREGDRVAKGTVIGIAGQTETYFVHIHFEMHESETGPDWMRGRLDPLLVLGPLSDCANSAAPTR